MRAAFLLLFCAASLRGQLVAEGPAWKGLQIEFVTRLEPGHALPSFNGSVIDEGVSGAFAQRFIDDPVHRATFGYELRLEPAPGGDSATLHIEPLHDPQHIMKNGWSRFGLPAGLPKYPVIPNLRVGDTVAIDLLVNPSTGQKIVDYLTLKKKGRATMLHDFSLADIQLFLDRPDVTVGDKTYPGTSPIGVAGSVVWLYIEGYGRYIFSLFPNEKSGFRKNGAIYSGELQFRDRDTPFRVSSKSAIAPGDGPYNLYMLSQPSWHPGDSFDPIRIGAASNIESLLEAH
ncbi:MAG TPA: hypothetical protein VHC90_16535 [Bryobacteraceae bacterium]|nr:hypothetical protein [Bryobacteraceae bacterium]